MTVLSSDCLFRSDHLLKRGFTIFQSDKLKDWAGIDTFDRYRQSVMSFREKSRQFFELDLSVKHGFEAPLKAYLPELNGFGPGWWPESTYADPANNNPDYDIQYILSNVYEDCDRPVMFDFEAADSESYSLGGHYLPNPEGNVICDFINEFILNRLCEDLAANLNVAIPKVTQQFQIAYYSQRGVVGKHTDTPFVMGNVGPTQNLYILPFDTQEPYQVVLGEGEVLLYPGRQFGEVLASVDRQLPPALPHWVNGRKGRVAILLGCFISKR